MVRNTTRAYAVKKSSANTAGTELATSAKTGAGSVDFNPVGSQMAAGVASGINAGAPDAVDAMKSLVDQVNAEAKKKAEIKSPSRLFKREIGFQLPAGIAVGIAEKGYLAVNAVKEVVSDIYTAASEGSEQVGFLNDGSLRVLHDTDTSSESTFFNEMLNKLDELIQQRMAVYLETGVLVGETAPAMDSELGRKSKRERRNSLW